MAENYPAFHQFLIRIGKRFLFFGASLKAALGVSRSHGFNSCFASKCFFQDSWLAMRCFVIRSICLADILAGRDSIVIL